MDRRVWRRFAFVIILAGSFVPQVNAQESILLLEKVLTNKHIIYRTGEQITYKLNGENFYRTSQISSLCDTAFQTRFVSISYSEVARVHLKKNRFPGLGLRQIGTYAQIVGPAYIAIDQFNQVVVRGEDASFNDEVFLTGGLIFAGGTILKLMDPKKIKLGSKYRLVYLRIN